MKSKSQDTQHASKLREAGDLLHDAADHLESAPQAAAASTDSPAAPGKFDWTKLITVLTQVLPIILQLFQQKQPQGPAT